MGTNYYTWEDEPCDKCGRADERMHIGKSSAGWVFSLHRIHEHGLTDWESWERFLDGRTIVDEYGETKILDELRKTVTERKHPRGLVKEQVGSLSWNHPDYDTNFVRIGPGEPTWQMVDGWFL